MVLINWWLRSSIHGALCGYSLSSEAESTYAKKWWARSRVGHLVNWIFMNMEWYQSYCIGALAGVTEVIPSTLAETTGLNPISSVTVLRNHMSSPGWCDSMYCTLAWEPKSRRFNSQLGCMLGWEPGPHLGACEATDQCVLHVDVSLPLFLPPFPSL